MQEDQQGTIKNPFPVINEVISDFDSKLTDDAKIIHNKHYHTIEINLSDGKKSTAVFLGFQASEKDWSKGSNRLANIFNMAVEKKLINYGVLSPAFTLQLPISDCDGNRRKMFMIYAFLNIDTFPFPEDKKEFIYMTKVMNNIIGANLFSLEGELPIKYSQIDGNNI